ncbi:S8 family serine peptidase, partial [bacterium]|nr:S8 family serine peptidase [bacterium]
MKRCCGRVWIGVAVMALMIGTAVFAADNKVVVDGETYHFDLDRSRIAVGFASTATAADQTVLLAALSNIGAPAVRQVEEPLGMSLLNLKANATESEVYAALSALESSSAVDWAGPVLIYDRQEHIPTRKVCVQFEKTTGADEIARILGKHGFSLIKSCDDWAAGVVYAERSKGRATLDACNALALESAVEWAEPDWIRTVRLNTNDTYFGSQWYLNQAGDHDIDAPEAWNITTGNSSIVISICDVGVQIAHVDLNDHIEAGYDAVDSDNDPTPATSYQGDGHGTCCAGIAAAETNNSQGVAGVGYNCHVLGTRIGYIIGGSSIYTTNTWIVNCINYSRDSSDVMSNSWGGGTPSSSVNTALTNAKAAGLTILFASGNDNTSVQWPATQSTVIAVGATNESDYRCDPGDWGSGQGSNYGSQLDVVAPGNNQYTVDDSRAGAGYSSSGAYYSSFGGTSGACPVAAGVCALILSVNPSLTPDQVQTVLQNTAQDLVGDPAEDIAGWDQYMGWGRVNAYQAVLSAGGIVVTSPNGGETWYTNESHNITWTGTGFTGNVNIHLSRNGGGTWESLYSNTANDGIQAWTVSGAVTTQARVRVSSVSVPSIRDSSDADFTIASPFVQVQSPNGGETWY